VPKEENDPLWRLRCGRLTIAGSFPRSPTQQRAVGYVCRSITCALFLQRFVEHSQKSWFHVDIYGGRRRKTGTPGRRRMPGRARDL